MNEWRIKELRQQQARLEAEYEDAFRALQFWPWAEDQFGNPSSPRRPAAHMKAKQRLEKARQAMNAMDLAWKAN